MTETSEAPVVGQSMEKIDIAGMSQDDIANRIESDSVFAKAYMDDRVYDSSASAEDKADAVTNTEETVETPASLKQESAEQPAEPVFTIKRGELPQGYDTPGKVFKSLTEKQNYIETVQNQVRQRDSKIKELEAELSQERLLKTKAEVTQNEEFDESNMYDPDYMKEQFKRLQKMDRLETELNSLKEKVGKTEQKQQYQDNVSSEMKELRRFQDTYQIFKTNRPIEEIDLEYANFVTNIATIAGVDPGSDDALRYVSTFLNDKGEDGNNLRAAAEKNGIRLPDEFEPYSNLLTIRQAAREATKIDRSTGQPRSFTLEESFKQTFPEMYIQAIKPSKKAPEPSSSASPKELKTKELERMRVTAEAVEAERATEIAPASSGKGTSVDDLSEDQVEALFKMTTAELRANPTKKKLLDEVYIRLGMPILNVNDKISQ